jgi:hypothetical protein
MHNIYAFYDAKDGPHGCWTPVPFHHFWRFSTGWARRLALLTGITLAQRLQ